MQNALQERRRLTRTLSTPLLLANLAMLVTVIFWGISFISIKIAVSEVPPITMALIRFVIASLILLVILRKTEPATRLQKGDRLRMLLAGFLGITLYFCFENSGVKLTTASNASLIVSVVPVITIIMDIFIFKTRVSAIQWLGIAGAVAGAYLAVTANGHIDFTSATFKGNALVVGAMLSWAIYTLLNKNLQDKYSGLFLTTYQIVAGTLFLLPLSLVECQQWHLFSLKALGNIVFLAVGCSAISYFLYIYALKRLDVTITTLYLNLIPIVGVASGYLILKETVLPVQLLGGAIIILVIVMVNLENMFRQGQAEKLG